MFGTELQHWNCGLWKTSRGMRPYFLPRALNRDYRPKGDNPLTVTAVRTAQVPLWISFIILICDNKLCPEFIRRYCEISIRIKFVHKFHELPSVLEADHRSVCRIWQIFQFGVKHQSIKPSVSFVSYFAEQAQTNTCTQLKLEHELLQVIVQHRSALRYEWGILV